MSLLFYNNAIAPAVVEPYCLVLTLRRDSKPTLEQPTRYVMLMNIKPTFFQYRNGLSNWLVHLLQVHIRIPDTGTSHNRPKVPTKHYVNRCFRFRSLPLRLDKAWQLFVLDWVALSDQAPALRWSRRRAQWRVAGVHRLVSLLSQGGVAGGRR